MTRNKLSSVTNKSLIFKSVMEKVKLTTSQLLADLQAGLTRKEIGVKYGLNNRQVGILFQHPKLKGRKTAKISFDLEDDLPETEVAEQVTEEASIPEPIATEPVAQVEEEVSTEPVGEVPESFFDDEPATEENPTGGNDVSETVGWRE